MSKNNRIGLVEWDVFEMPKNDNDYSAIGGGLALNGSTLAFMACSILVFAFTILLGLPHETADEGFHTPQIWAFYSGDYKIDKSLTVLPVYHAVIAMVLKSVGYFSIPFARFVHLLIAALCIPVFYKICRQLSQDNADLRTLQFLSFPIILPFFCLIYTDMPALLFVLLMVFYTLKKSYYWAASFALIAIFMRQTNLIWVFFCCALIWGDSWSQLWANRWQSVKSVAPGLIFKCMPYGLAASLLFAFFVFNGGVAVGDSHQHQVSVNFSNLYFFLLLTFLFFLPYVIACSGKIVDILRSSPKVWYALVVAFLVYMATYSNGHQYNSFGLSFYIRNVILHYTVEFPAARAFAFIPMAWMALTFFVVANEAKDKWRMWLLYFFMVISIVPLPLVEQRYYIVALVLFMALKPNVGRTFDLACLFIYLPINAVLLFYIGRAAIFL